MIGRLYLRTSRISGRTAALVLQHAAAGHAPQLRPLAGLLAAQHHPRPLRHVQHQLLARPRLSPQPNTNQQRFILQTKKKLVAKSAGLGGGTTGHLVTKKIHFGLFQMSSSSNTSDRWRFPRKPQ